MVFVGIGNSDNKLTQAQWSAFVGEIEQVIVNRAAQVHGAWFSRPDSPWQNCCWCFETELAPAEEAKRLLANIGRFYNQDSVAWSEALTEFI